MPNPAIHPDTAPEAEGDGIIATLRDLVSDRPPAPQSTRPPAARPAPLLLTPQQRVPAPAALADGDLRALVADAVRAELQGQTGTRFTRQLRRLIRAEIAEALAARGL